MYTFVCTIRSNVGSPAVSVWVTHPAARISTRYGTDRFHAGANIRMADKQNPRGSRGATNRRLYPAGRYRGGHS